MIVHKATMQTVMRAQAASSAMQVPFKMKRKKARARVVKLVSPERPKMHPLTACYAREAGIKILRSRRRVYHAFQVPTMMRKDKSSASFVMLTLLLTSLLNIRAKTVLQVKSQWKGVPNVRNVKAAKQELELRVSARNVQPASIVTRP
jgi:hypothetical protein